MAETVSDYIVKRLQAWGVERVYGYSGDGINGLMEALRKAESALAEIDRIDCQPAQGSFYCLPEFSRVIESLDDVDEDQQMADWLLDELGVAMVPGSGFSAPGNMRLSFAADSDTLDKGLARLQEIRKLTHLLASQILV